MNINHHFKSLLILASVLSSVLAFGLFAYYSPDLFLTRMHEVMPKPYDPADTIYTAKPPAPDSLFKAALKSYERYFLEKDYDLCLKELEKAEKISPKDISVKDKISKIKVLIADKKQKQLEASKSLASGDLYFKAKDYLNAKASYQIAVGLTPDDAVATEKLKQTMILLRSQKASNTLYDVAVASADKLFQEKEYEKAKQEYENASKILPSEAYARNRINEIIKIQVDLQVKEESYSKFLANADNLYAAKSFAAALTDYKNASAIKPTEKYPRERIEELTALLAAQKVKEDAYKKAIGLADKYFNETRYTESVKGYQDALVIKPAEDYPKLRIKEIEGILARTANAAEEYEKYIALADSFYIDKNYSKARENYLIASSVKPKESYPKEMLQKAEKMLPAQEAAIAIDNQYRQFISEADNLFAAKTYELSRAVYQKAIGLKPGENYPISKIAAIDKIFSDMADKELAQKRSLEESYATAIRTGDSLLALKSYNPALKEFLNAEKLKPAESYPKTKVAEINQIFSTLANDKKAAEQYLLIIANGDKLMGEKRYESARTVYINAGKMKPDEQYPKDKIAEIDRLFNEIAAKKGLDEQYKQLIAQADKLFTSKSYTEAKQAFLTASGLKPEESYPKIRIADIEKALGEIARQASFEEQYVQAIAEGDKLLLVKSYNEARLKYLEALKIKPTEQYPKLKISEADAALNEIAKLKSIDDQYNAAIENADKLLAGKKFETSRTAYVEAGKIKPSAQYPKDKIAEINTILEGIANQKAIDDRYNASIIAADKLLLSSAFQQARTEYVNAGNIKPAEQYPKDKILEIDKSLGEIAVKKALDEQYTQTITVADKLFLEKNYDQAKLTYQNASGLKPAEVYPKTKTAEIEKVLAEIARLKALEEQYAGTVAEADRLFTVKSFSEAVVKYQDALKIKPAEAYPKQKITEAEFAMAEIAKQRAVDEQYNAIVKNADVLFAAKSFTESRNEFTNALKVKPMESYPKDKIVEIDKAVADIAARKKAVDDNYKAVIQRADQLLSSKTYEQAKSEYQNASTIKPEEQYPKIKSGQIDSILSLIANKKALDEEYSRILADGDKQLAAKSYEEAKIAYNAAAALKPAEQYPKLKLAEAEKGISEIARRRALDDQYNSIIEKADKYLAEKSYDLAKSAYIEAGKVKPAEQYPKDKIAEVTSLLTSMAKQKALDDQFNLLISKADQLLLLKNYLQARTEFQGALKIRPEAQYPKEKTAEIDDILAELKAKDAQYKEAVTKADQLLLGKKYEEARTEYQIAGQIRPEMSYPNEKIAEINKALTELKGKRQTFDDLVANADNKLQQKEWNLAKDLYRQALIIFPDEIYPKSKIALVDSKIDSIYRANKPGYDKAVADGDRFFSNFEFDKAIDAFTNALTLLPMESYPKEMISKIRRTISENAIVDVLKTTVTIPAGTEKQFPFPPVNMSSRKNNFVYLKIRNLTNKPFNVLMRYGKDKQSNGGVVIKNLSLDGKVNERLVSVREQDAWYREENNWISLYPQGGDIEVTFIQVSRAKQE